MRPRMRTIIRCTVALDKSSRVPGLALQRQVAQWTFKSKFGRPENRGMLFADQSSELIGFSAFKRFRLKAV